MDPNQPVSLSLGDVSRILAAVRTEERRDRGREGTPLASSRDHSQSAVWRVVITGSLDGEYYPARLEALTETDPPTWEEIDPSECWVLPLTGQTFEEDDEVVGFVAGEFNGRAVIVGANITGGSGGGSGTIQNRQRARITAAYTSPSKVIDVQPVIWDATNSEWDDTGSPITGVFHQEVFGIVWKPVVGAHVEIWSEGGGSYYARPIGPATVDSPGWISTRADQLALDIVTPGAQIMSGSKIWTWGAAFWTAPYYTAINDYTDFVFSVGTDPGQTTSIKASYFKLDLGYAQWTVATPPGLDVDIRACSGASGDTNGAWGGVITVRTYSEGTIWLVTGDATEAAFGQGQNENEVLIHSDGATPGVKIMAHGQEGPIAPGVKSANAQLFVTKALDFSSSSVTLASTTSKGGSFGYQATLTIETDNSGLEVVHTNVLMQADGGFAVGSNVGVTGTFLGMVYVGGILVNGAGAAVTITTSTPTNITGLFAGNGSTIAGRTLTGPAAGITVTNGNGASGNPTLALANDLSAVEGLSGTGLAVRTAADTWATRSITSTGGTVTVTNGDGVSGNVNLEVATSSLIPTGTVIPFAGVTVPTGWLLCDGSAVSRTTYAALFAALKFDITGTTTNTVSPVTGISAGDLAKVNIGAALSGTGISAGSTVISYNTGAGSLNQSIPSTASGTVTITVYPFGYGDGSTTFNVPDLRRRVVMGSGGTATSTIDNRQGAAGGAENHTLTTSEIPSHTHTYNQGNPANLGASGGGLGVFGSPNQISTASGSAGGGSAHNNIQPSIVLNCIIKT